MHCGWGSCGWGLPSVVVLNGKIRIMVRCFLFHSLESLQPLSTWFYVREFVSSQIRPQFILWSPLHFLRGFLCRISWKPWIPLSNLLKTLSRYIFVRRIFAHVVFVRRSFENIIFVRRRLANVIFVRRRSRSFVSRHFRGLRLAALSGFWPVHNRKGVIK